jgi:hypothetical protein
MLISLQARRVKENYCLLLISLETQRVKENAIKEISDNHEEPNFGLQMKALFCCHTYPA